ncbi:helix-turn-helix transcriptional regulator [Gemmiger formicilis]|uniref:helix-turn-helix transcriptional regulator n=1 Tax=Gemmiger formicilis TaxID=745368 RepID=UPI0031F70278
MSNARYDFAPRVRVQSSVNLLYVTRSRYEGDWHSLPHTHHCAELFYVLNGSGFFQVENEQFPLRPNDMVLVNPQVEHTEVSFSDSPMEYIVIGVEGVHFLDERQNETRYTRLTNLPDREDYLFYLRTLLREMESPAIGHDIICQGLTEVLLAQLSRHIVQVEQKSGQRKAGHECTKARRYIDENYTENITLDFLAELTHMNKYYLVHAFNREVGCSPINYLIARRITESKRLLASTNHSVSQISQVLGFSSPSYFSQSFKKALGVGPSEYRRRAQNQAAAADAAKSADE